MIYLLFVIGMAEGTCVAYDCLNLGINVCAIWRDNQIVLNSLGCGNGNICLQSTISSAIESGGASGTVSCEAGTYSHEFDSTPNCSGYNADDDLMEGTYPKVKNSDNDCMLVSGELGESKCGMNGYEYCVPKLSSNAFSDFYNYCTRNNNELSSKIKKLWQFTHYYYVEMVTGPRCLEDILTDLSLTLIEFTESAIALIVTVYFVF